ncbi:MAG: hypothetical protein BROFUL_01319 [Candidatus Brocadia fulgida]|uniref:Transposase n=1 Tax=Candidatus Brocadia fulgida TaxID=380242 RepID=A0A0M2UYC1_9BACT|nr:MAG: hypothetical protein BROFUL_01319 [Candidatus Brocadia fulgida]
MDRGIPTEEMLEKMRERGIDYLVGTPKGHLTRVEKPLLEQTWMEQAVKRESDLFPSTVIWRQLERRIEYFLFGFLSPHSKTHGSFRHLSYLL